MEVAIDSKTDLGTRQAAPSNDSYKIKTLEEILEEKKRRKATSQASVEQVDSTTTKPPPTKLADKALRGVGSPPGKVSTAAGRKPRKVTSEPQSPPGKVWPSTDRNPTKITPQLAADAGKEGEEAKKADAVKGRRRIRVTKTAAQPSSTGELQDVGTVSVGNGGWGRRGIGGLGLFFIPTEHFPSTKTAQEANLVQTQWN